MEFEKNRLLLEDSEEEIHSDVDSYPARSRSLRDFMKQNWITGCTLLYAYVATALLLWIFLKEPTQLSIPYSPISHLVHPIVEDVYPAEHSKYYNEPSEEFDTAWAELVAPMLISAKEDEVALTSETVSERLELTTGGYLGSLGVFHELHCLRRLYWHMHEEIYFPNITASGRDYERKHARHCIETLRLSLMCQANTALYTFEWNEHNTHSKQVLSSKAQRQCIKWDLVHEWASSRSVGLNPTFYRPGAKPEF